MPSRSKSSSPRTPQPTPVESSDTKSARQQLSKVVGINLSVSRVRRYVDNHNINSDINTACEELKLFADGKNEEKELSPSTALLVTRAYSEIYDLRRQKHDALRDRLKNSKSRDSKKRLKALKPFPERLNTFQEQLEYVGKLRYRFSSDSTVALAAALDFVVQELARSAMVNAKAKGKAIIQVEHLCNEDFHTLSVYPLLYNLDVVKNQLLSQSDDSEEQEDDSKEEESHSSTFEFYVNEICKTVKAQLVEEDESYSSIRK